MFGGQLKQDFIFLTSTKLDYFCLELKQLHNNVGILQNIAAISTLWENDTNWCWLKIWAIKALKYMMPSRML